MGLYDYGARWYDAYLNRFLSSDPIVPSTGEGTNPNAIGYVADAYYSALVVDYHETQFLEQLNQENRVRLENPNVRLPGVPTNPLAFDRYAYSFNNPVRYNYPSGHNPIVLVLAAVGPVGWAVLGVLAVGTIVYFAVDGPHKLAAALAPSVESAATSVSNTTAASTTSLLSEAAPMQAKVLQRGLGKLTKDTEKKLKENLGLTGEEIQRALEDMKRDSGRRNDDHGTIMDNGDVNDKKW